MTVDIHRGETTKPISSDALEAAVASLVGAQGTLTIGFPLMKSDDGVPVVDAVLVSQDQGAILFELVEEDPIESIEDRHDEIARLFEQRLLSNPTLYSRRRLQIDINVISFSDSVTLPDPSEMYPTANSTNLAEALERLHCPQGKQNSVLHDALVSAVQGLSSLRSRARARRAEIAGSRGSTLKTLEGRIATLDKVQSKAVLETIDGVQRIRGLAGSGKTIILALKAAYLHFANPDWKIAVTYNTRSLHGQFRRLITKFYLDEAGEEPNWDNLQILNAWGSAKSSHGIYSLFCALNDVQFLDFKQASMQFGSSNAFGSACKAALDATNSVAPQYDLVLVDEAQDLPVSFLELAHQLTTDPHRLVYAYDELQSLDGAGLPAPEEIFGHRADGSPRVTLERQPTDRAAERDIVLERCYRNPRPVLVTAHALGLGVYRTPSAENVTGASGGTPTGIVQIFEQVSLWEEVGYEVSHGELRPGSDVTLVRTSASSPPFLEEHSALDDLILFHAFESKSAQDDWVAGQVHKNITEEELSHDDIVVINPNGATARKNLATLRAKLLEKGIQNHLAGVDTAGDVFFDYGNNSVTFTGIHRAKGNEAGMVYVVNAQEGQASHFNLASTRNRLFTAITRSKAWVRVLGHGQEMLDLMSEYERIRDKNFTLDFTYPTLRQMEKLRILHRDLSASDQRTLHRRQDQLGQLVEALSEGKIRVEDFDPELLRSLNTYLTSGENG